MTMKCVFIIEHECKNKQLFKIEECLHKKAYTVFKKGAIGSFTSESFCLSLLYSAPTTTSELFFRKQQYNKTITFS